MAVSQGAMADGALHAHAERTMPLSPPFFQSLAEARRIIGDFITQYNTEWFIERLGHQTPMVRTNRRDGGLVMKQDRTVASGSTIREWGAISVCRTFAYVSR